MNFWESVIAMVGWSRRVARSASRLVSHDTSRGEVGRGLIARFWKPGALYPKP